MIPDSPDREFQPDSPQPSPKPRRAVSERARRSYRANLVKARQASACKRKARAKERKREWRRQHGYWFFHRWGLYAIPFTRTLKRLGESVPGFITLLTLAERWLVRGSDKWQVTSDEREGEKQKSEVRTPEPRAPKPESRLVGPEPRVPSPESLFPNPQPLNRIASKVARALAQVLWLRPRVIRQRALDRAIRLEARLRTVAELQGILHGVQGAEAQARLTAQMKQELSCETLEEYKYMRMLGMEPSELWPRRLAWRIALRVREALEEGFAQERDLKAIRRRVELLLEAYQTAAEISPSCGAGSQPACDRSLPTGQPGFDSAVGAPLVGALVDPTPGTSNVASAKARQRKLDRLRQVEESSVERLGSPFQAPGKVRRRLAGEVRPRRAASQQQTTEQKNSSGEPGQIDEFQAELERKLEEQRLRDPEWLEMERQEAKERRITVEQLRRSQQALKTRPDPVGVRRFWDPEAGWCAEIKAWWGRYAVRISEMTGGREERCWPVVRELELRAEVEAARRGREPIEAGPDGREFVRVAPPPCCAEGLSLSAPPDKPTISKQGFDALPERQSLSAQQGGKAAFSRTPGRGVVGAGPRARPDEDDESAGVICGHPEALASVDRSDVASKIGLLSLQGRAQGPAPSADAVDPGLTYPELKRLLTEAFGLAPGWPIAWDYTPPSDPAVADYLDIALPRPPASREVIERKLERVARLAWLTIEGERRRADQETARLEQILAAARPGEFEPTAQALIALEAEDRESEFKSGERWARLSEALRNLLESMYGDYGEFGRMRGAAVWFDPELKQMMRQDLGLDPMPEDFETPEPPEQFVHERRQFLDGLEALCAGRRYGPTGRPTWCDPVGEDG